MSPRRGRVGRSTRRVVVLRLRVARPRRSSGPRATSRGSSSWRASIAAVVGDLAAFAHAVRRCRSPRARRPATLRRPSAVTTARPDAMRHPERREAVAVARDDDQVRVARAPRRCRTPNRRRRRPARRARRGRGSRARAPARRARTSGRSGSQPLGRRGCRDVTLAHRQDQSGAASRGAAPRARRAPNVDRPRPWRRPRRPPPTRRRVPSHPRSR